MDRELAKWTERPGCSTDHVTLKEPTGKRDEGIQGTCVDHENLMGPGSGGRASRPHWQLWFCL